LGERAAPFGKAAANHANQALFQFIQTLRPLPQFNAGMHLGEPAL
jgi:hypothetical protein